MLDEMLDEESNDLFEKKTSFHDLLVQRIPTILNLDEEHVTKGQ